MEIIKLSSDEKIAYLIKPILSQLQNAGGQLTKNEIRERICNDNDDIADFESIVSTSKRTGNDYKKFNFCYNWAIKDLSFLQLINYTAREPLITLTDKGINTDVDALDPLQDVVIPAKASWVDIRELKKQDELKESEEISNSDISTQDKYDTEFSEKLLEAISKMTPKKFEMFSRSLLKKMGVQFTERGVQMTNDGGLDGFGYHRDSDDFRTSKVVIQCKRYNSAPVQSPDIDKFLGVVSKNQADYGIFITNSRFTSGARETAVQGKPITLIDGEELVRLVKKYELYVKPVTTYELLDFYYDNEDIKEL